MRRFISRLFLPTLTLLVLALPILALPAAAEEPAKADKPAPHSPRQTWQQHFSQANAAHDGHLTLEEAKSGFPLIAKHFDDIDIEHKGYVTENDVRAWRILRKASHRQAQPPDKLKPQHAFQRHPLNADPVFPTRTASLAGDLPAIANR